MVRTAGLAAQNLTERAKQWAINRTVNASKVLEEHYVYRTSLAAERHIAELARRDKLDQL